VRHRGVLVVEVGIVEAEGGVGRGLEFAGRGLLLAFDFGRTSGEIRYRLDGGEWKATQRDCPAWAGEAGWLRTLLIDEALPPGPHLFELETLPGLATAGRGTRTVIGLIGVMD
jgi:hypothetical protein